MSDQASGEEQHDYKQREPKLWAHIEKKIAFTPETEAIGIDKFDPNNSNHRNMIIARIIDLAVDVYGGGGPGLNSHRCLDAGWSIRYTTQTGDTAEKHYDRPIEVLSPFNSSAIVKIEILYAGSGP